MTKKIISILLLLIFTYTSAFGSVSRDQFYTIDDFSKGLNSHVSIFKTPDNQLAEALNVRVNKVYGAASKREALITHFDSGAAAATGLHRYYKSDGTYKTIAANGTTLVIGDTDAVTTIGTGFTDGKWWQFVTYQDNAIGGNGFDQPIKYDGHTDITANTTGHRTADNLVAELGAPYAQLLTGANLDASSWYRYMIVFYDGSTYDYSTAKSNSIDTGAAVRDITLTDIPIGPTGTTNRYIYRTEGQADKATLEAVVNTSYKLAITINNNTTITTPDAVADGALGAAWTATGTDTTPPLGALFLLHKEKLFISGNVTYKSQIYWSDDFNPDHFLPTDYEEIRPDDGDEITFIKNQLGILTVGKTNTIQRFYTDKSSTSDWYVSDPYTYIGCPAPYSVANSPLGIFYLSRYGLYIYNGQSVSLVSDAVTAQIADISPNDIGNTVGIFHNDEYHLAYTSMKTGGSTNNRELIYSLTRDAYVLDTKNINCYAAFNSGTDIGTLYSGSSTTDGVVVAHASSTSNVGARYQSDFNAGTYDDTMIYGTENDPILSMESLDRMEDYYTDALAQAAWITTDTDLIPSDLGTGADGDYTISADETISGTKNYGDLTIDAGDTLTIDASVTLYSEGTITVNGTINVTGIGSTLDIRCQTLVVGAAGIITTEYNNFVTIEANTITNGGLIEDDITTSVAGYSFSGNESTIDGDYNTAYNIGPVNGSSGGGYSTISFDSIVINRIRFKYYGSSNWITAQPYSYGIFNLYHTAAWNTITGDVSGTSSDVTSASFFTIEDYDDTGWTATGMRLYTYATAPAGSTAHAKGYEMTMWGEPSSMAYISDTGITKASTSTATFVKGLQCYSEGTEVNQGDYSLKVVCAEGADTLNEHLEKTITSIDLSAATHDTILIDVKATRNGTNFQLGIGEAAGTDNLVNVPIAGANEWETVELDFSGVADASKNAIIKLALKFTNTDASNMVYVDNIRPALAAANWTSPVYEINAESLDNLYWNEELGDYGDVTMQIRLNTTATMSGTVASAANGGAGEVDLETSAAHGLVAGDYVTIAGTTDYNGNFEIQGVASTTNFSITDTWVSDQAGTYEVMWNTAVTSPAGSDLSSLTAHEYAQFRINLTTTNTHFDPYLYEADGFVFRLIYSKLGTLYETTVTSTLKTGWKNFKVEGYEKLIKRIKVFYEGTDGILVLNAKNDEGDIDRDISIILSIEPDDDTTDNYTGQSGSKVYTYYPSVNTEEAPSMVGAWWMFTIEEDGTDLWTINKVQVLFQVEEIDDV